MTDTFESIVAKELCIRRHPKGTRDEIVRACDGCTAEAVAWLGEMSNTTDAVRCKCGNMVTHWLNGEPMCDCCAPPPTFTESDLCEVARRALQEDGDSLDASSAVAVVDGIVREFQAERGKERPLGQRFDTITDEARAELRDYAEYLRTGAKKAHGSFDRWRLAHGYTPPVREFLSERRGEK